MNWGFVAFLILMTVRFLNCTMKDAKEGKLYVGIASSFGAMCIEVVIVLWAMHWRMQ